MNEHRWWKEATVYQIYPQSFRDSNGDGIGDIPGIISKLDYLAWLGVDVVWLSPIYPSPGFDNGYDISDYEAIDARYGTMADFDRLIEEAHRRGLRVVLDLVVNHTSDEHPWFIESGTRRESPKRDYYIWRDGSTAGEPNNWGALFGGPAWTRDARTGQYYLHLFSPHQPDLNWDNPALRGEVHAMMRRWLDRGVDGFRLDVISLISKPHDMPDARLTPGGYGDARPLVANGPRVHEFLHEMREKVLAGRDVMMVGEASGTTLEEARRYAALTGDELDMVFQFEHMDLDGGETFKWNTERIRLSELKSVLDTWQLKMAGIAWNTLFWNNHDQPRIVSRLGDEGALRERSAAMLACCLYLMQGTPFLFQGEEIGMTNMPFTGPEQLRDPESIDAYRRLTASGRFSPSEMMACIRAKSRDNARTPMQWSGRAHAGFSAAAPWMDVNPNYPAVNVEEQMGRADSALSFYRRLLRLRRKSPVATYGAYAPVAHPDVYAYLRALDNVQWLVMCNFRSHAVRFDAPEAVWARERAVLSNVERSAWMTTRTLAPYEALVLQRNTEESS